MKPLGYELDELLDWDEHLNGKKITIHKSAYSFSHSRLLATFVDYDSGKSPAPQLQRLSQQIAAGVEALKKRSHTCELEVMRKLYDKKNISMQKNTVKLKKRKYYFQNDKVVVAKKNCKRKNQKWGLVVMIDCK
jgi:glucan-binding YG repeat protein